MLVQTKDPSEKSGQNASPEGVWDSVEHQCTHAICSLEPFARACGVNTTLPLASSVSRYFQDSFDPYFKRSGSVRRTAVRVLILHTASSMS